MVTVWECLLGLYGERFVEVNWTISWQIALYCSYLVIYLFEPCFVYFYPISWYGTSLALVLDSSDR